MPSCVYRKCTNYDAKTNKGHGISYHMFPMDEVTLQEWIAIVREQRSEFDWKPSKSSRICSNHFRSEDKYTSNKGRMLLKKHAVPVIEEREILDTVNYPSSYVDVIVSETGEILESPKPKALPEKIIRKLIFEKKQLQRKNNALTIRNKNLKKKLTMMAALLRRFKRQIVVQKHNLQKFEVGKSEIERRE